MGNYMMPIEEVKEKIKKIHGNTLSIVENTYLRCNRKATFIDSIYGKWIVHPTHVIRGRIHPKRCKEKRRIKLLKKIEKKLKKRYGDIITLDSTTFVKSTLKARFIDKEFGEFWSYSRSVLAGHTNKKRRNFNQYIPIEEVKKRIFNKHGDNICIIESSYKGLSNKAIFIDKEFGKWITVVRNVVDGQGNPTRGKESRAKKNQVSIKEIKKRIFSVHSDIITIDESTYKGISNKARFIHKIYGEWWTLPEGIIKGRSHPKNWLNKSKDTCLKKYGTSNPMQNIEIAKRSSRNMQKRIIKYHWKTNEELVCQSTWESKVVDYLNLNKIEYKWQSKIFIMPSNKTYRPDLYLINEDKWIEIKGYFRGDALEKWEWFHKKYLNSELWDKNKLKEIKIL